MLSAPPTAAPFKPAAGATQPTNCFSRSTLAATFTVRISGNPRANFPLPGSLPWGCFFYACLVFLNSNKLVIYQQLSDLNQNSKNKEKLLAHSLLSP
ncbi:MAG: hypothetical protein AAAB16_01755, partial [Pseudomonas sp.]|uniref:hypothetical protein n=1 Tax=Pseudomonas sp. TaxID=306 RepID=UPI0030F32D16